MTKKDKKKQPHDDKRVRPLKRSELESAKGGARPGPDSATPRVRRD